MFYHIFVPQNKCSFADISLSALPTQRNYFGSQHGKGEADGETGRFAQALARSVAAGESFQYAADMVAFGASQFPSTEFRK